MGPGGKAPPGNSHGHQHASDNLQHDKF